MRQSPLRDAIVNAPVLRTIRKRLVPKSWRDQVKRLWQIKQRPQLSNSSVQRLEEVFDADLSRLGGWLNIELSCRNFHEVAKSTVPTWSQTSEPLTKNQSVMRNISQIDNTIYHESIGAVAIGRNEGERLRRCLDSLIGRGLAIVYVDSNSVDGSAELARSLGAEVVQLDLSRPFTAARARNEGFERLCQVDPAVRFVQFVDGDCEVLEGWLEECMQYAGGEPRHRSRLWTAAGALS